MRRLLRTLPPRAAVRRLSNKSAPPRRAAVVRRLSDGKSLEDLVRNKTAAAVAANQPPPPTAEAPKTAIVPPDVAHDLCHEVGWESRHSFVDVRGTEAFARGRPKGAVNAPFVDGALDADGIPTEPGRLVVGGGSQKSVTAAADVLRARGFDVIAMAGGFDAWRGLGLPVDVDGVVDDEEDDDGDPSTWN